mmetsp:Transcript_7169/g.18365  ORF Transcript_7169/g.18365 Transcript_7169/m.18365 type:complete len:298 (-) Transcript_7169:403-1296(-)
MFPRCESSATRCVESSAAESAHPFAAARLRAARRPPNTRPPVPRRPSSSGASIAASSRSTQRLSTRPHEPSEDEDALCPGLEEAAVAALPGTALARAKPGPPRDKSVEKASIEPQCTAACSAAAPTSLSSRLIQRRTMRSIKTPAPMWRPAAATSSRPRPSSPKCRSCCSAAVLAAPPSRRPRHCSIARGSPPATDSMSLSTLPSVSPSLSSKAASPEATSWKSFRHAGAEPVACASWRAFSSLSCSASSRAANLASSKLLRSSTAAHTCCQYSRPSASCRRASCTSTSWRSSCSLR